MNDNKLPATLLFSLCFVFFWLIMEKEEFNIVLKDGRLIVDNNNRILMCDQEGNYFYVLRELLPENFLEQVHNEQEKNDTDSSQSMLITQKLPLTNESSTEQANEDIMDHSLQFTSGEITRLGSDSPIQIDTVNEQAHTNETAANASEERAHWTRRQILSLINAYKDNRHVFQSNSMKNSVGWRRVSEAVGSHSAKQCEAKFKYLKALYTKKKDNMGSGSSGARAVSFEYFEDMDEIFRAEPNIVPLNLASSSTLTLFSEQTQPSLSTEAAATTSSHSTDDPINDGLLTEPPASVRPPKRKRTRLEIQLEKFQKGMELREAARERRLDKFLQAQEASTNKICNMLQKFIDKI